MGTRVIGSIPKDKDRAAVLGALSYLDGETVVPIYGDPANGALLVENSGGGGGGGTQYASGTATPSPVTGNALIFDNSGTLEDVSIANPLPVSATFSGSINTAPTFAMNPSAGSPTAAFGLIDASYRPIIVGAGTAGTPAGGVLSIQGVTSGTAIPVSGTFYQATQPVSLATNTPTLQSGSKTQIVDGSGNVIASTSNALNVSANITGGNITGFATSANQTNKSQITQLSDGTNPLMGSAAALTDTTTNPTLAGIQAFPMTFNGTTWDRVHGYYPSGDAIAIANGLYTLPQTLIFNGSSWDRARGVTAAAGTSGTGLLGVGTMVYDGTNYQSLTTNSTTYTSKFGADVNLLGTKGTAFTTAGFIDVKGADGNVFVRQTTGSNLHVVADSGSTTAVTQGTAANLNATVVGTGTFAVQSAQSGSWTVGTTSAAVNVGQQTVSTSAVQISASSTVPTNGILVGALSTNSASIFIGGSGVTTSNGVELQAGSSLPFTANLNTLYIISAASSSDKIWYNVT